MPDEKGNTFTMLIKSSEQETAFSPFGHSEIGVVSAVTIPVKLMDTKAESQTSRSPEFIVYQMVKQ